MIAEAAAYQDACLFEALVEETKALEHMNRAVVIAENSGFDTMYPCDTEYMLYRSSAGLGAVTMTLILLMKIISEYYTCVGLRPDTHKAYGADDLIRLLF